MCFCECTSVRIKVCLSLKNTFALVTIEATSDLQIPIKVKTISVFAGFQKLVNSLAHMLGVDLHTLSSL